MKTKAWVGILLLMATFMAAAQSTRQMSRQAEVSMLLTGHVDVDAEGSVTSHQIDRDVEIPGNVVDLVARVAAKWRFEPAIHGEEAAPSRLRMTLRLVARPKDDGGYRVSIESGGFEDVSMRPTDRLTVSEDDKVLPSYPKNMAQRGVGATAYVVVKVGPDGRAEDAFVERVDLLAFGKKRDMERMRLAFAENAVDALLGWSYLPPTTGRLASDPYWVGRIVINYCLDQCSDGEPGVWNMYLPGPRNPSPDWMDKSGLGEGDALMAGEVQMGGGQRRLLTSLEGG